MGFLNRIVGALRGSGGPNIDFKSLVEAAKKGDVSALRRALDSDTDIVSHADGDGMTLLHFTAAIGNTEIAAMLLDSGAAVDAGNATGWTPLHFAALQGYEDMTALLIRRGAKIDAPAAGGQTPLQVARQYKRPGVIKLLTKKKGKRPKPTVEECVQKGTSAGERQDWTTSIDAFNRALKIDPDCAKAHCGLSLAYAATLDMAKAKKHYDRLKDLDPDLAARFAASPAGMVIARGGKIIGL
jgi:tetratricopeptide (TPR) repeat protein